MYFEGIATGAAVFLIIGICHPIVIKLEYHIGRIGWVIWLLSGLVFAALSVFAATGLLSTVLGAAAFSCFWAILEMFQQEQRVLKGWFPENPRRHAYYERKRSLMPKK